MQHSIGRPTSSGRIPPRRAAARGIARPGANDNVGGTPSRRPQCRTAEQAIRRMSEEAPGDPGRHLVDALVSISPDRGRLPTDRRPTRRRKDSAVDVPLGCPLPAVLPAVSRSVRRFLTRSDPQSPSVFPTNAGFLGDFAESGTGSKPGTRRTSSRSSTCSTVAPPSARTGHQDPRDRNRTSPIILIHLGVRAPLALRAPTRNLSSTSLRRPRSARRAPTSRPSRNPCTAKAQRARGRGVPPTPPQLLFTSNRSRDFAGGVHGDHLAPDELPVVLHRLPPAVPAGRIGDEDGAYFAEVERRARLVAELRKARVTRIRVTLPVETLDAKLASLPDGVSVSRGRIEVRFDGAENALERLFALAHALGNDYVRFEELVGR